MKDVSTMTAGQINAELDRLDVARSTICTALITAGRGAELPTETYKRNDPLSMRFIATTQRGIALRGEVDRRYGPGAPSRLPKGRGFGPIKSALGE